MNRRTLLLGTGAAAAMGVSAKALAMDASLPMKAADIDPAFEKAFNAGDLDALLKLYDEQSVLVPEPGKPVKGLDNIKQALTGFLALKLPIQLTVRQPAIVSEAEKSNRRRSKDWSHCNSIPAAVNFQHQLWHSMVDSDLVV